MMQTTMQTGLRDPTTGEPVTEFDRDGRPIVNSLDHPTLFWRQVAAAMVRSWGVGDGDEDAAVAAQDGPQRAEASE